jgi:hypothetical protein
MMSFTPSSTPTGWLRMSNTSETSSVLDTARSAAAEAGLDPAKLAQDVGAKLKDVAENQKHAGAEKVMGVARAIRNAAGNIEQESPEMARYVRSAASTIESFTRDFDDRSVDDLGQAVVDMAKRSPGLFFAGSMIAGFALFRFLNAAQGASSSSRNQNWSSRRGPSMQGGAQRNLQQRGSGQGGYGSASAGGYDVGGSSSSGSSSSGSSSSSSSSPSSSVGGSGSGGSYGDTTPSSSGAVSGSKSASNAGAAAGSTGSTGTPSSGGYGGGGQGAAKPASNPSSSASSTQGRGQS